MSFLKYNKLTNTHKVALITFFSSLYLYGHVGTLYLLARNLSLFQAASIGSIIVATIFLVEVPTGIIADKIGRRKSVMIAMLLQFVGEILYIFSHSYLAFALIAVLAGVGFAFASGCIEALIYDTLPKKNKESEMKKAMGLKGAAFYLAFFFAPLIGGLIIPIFTIDRFLLTVALTALSVFIAFLISFTLQEPETKFEHDEKSPKEILKNGIRAIKKSKFLLWLLGVSTFTATFAGTLGTLFQPYFASFDISAQKMGIASALGAILASILQKNVFYLEEKLGKKLIFSISVILPGIGYALLAMAPSAATAFFAFLLTYGVSDMKNPLISSYQNGVIPAKIRATVLSLMNIATSLYVAVIGLTMGWLADKNITYSFWFAAVLIVTFSILFRVDRVILKSTNITDERPS